jgi:hypothetical protein
MAVLLYYLAWGGFTAALYAQITGLSRLVTLPYAISAVVAATGLLKMRKWAFAAYLTWSGFVLVLLISMQVGHLRLALPLFLGLTCFAAILLGLLGVYVWRSLSKSVEPVSAANPPPPTASEGR